MSDTDEFSGHCERFGQQTRFNLPFLDSHGRMMYNEVPSFSPCTPACAYNPAFWHHDEFWYRHHCAIQTMALASAYHFPAEMAAHFQPRHCEPTQHGTKALQPTEGRRTRRSASSARCDGQREEKRKGERKGGRVARPRKPRTFCSKHPRRRTTRL